MLLSCFGKKVTKETEIRGRSVQDSAPLIYPPAAPPVVH